MIFYNEFEPENEQFKGLRPVTLLYSRSQNHYDILRDNIQVEEGQKHIF